jgi:hypothetical protein
MNAMDPNLVTLLTFAAGYILSRWDKRGDQGASASVAIAELRTELAGLRREVERLIDGFADRQTERGFGRRAARS